MAKIHDEENPADEDSFYVVSLAGSIGYCEDGEDIDWLFLADSSGKEDLPITFETVPQKKYCSNCGFAIVPGVRFCSKCGGQL